MSFILVFWEPLGLFRPIQVVLIKYRSVGAGFVIDGRELGPGSRHVAPEDQPSHNLDLKLDPRKQYRNTLDFDPLRFSLHKPPVGGVHDLADGTKPLSARPVRLN